MNNQNEEQQPDSEKSESLSWVARFFFALFTSPAIGMSLGFLSSMNVTGVDGAAGYAALYNGVIYTVFAFFGLLFIGNKKVQTVLAVLAAILWAVALFNM